MRQYLECRRGEVSEHTSPLLAIREGAEVQTS